MMGDTAAYESAAVGSEYGSSRVVSPTADDAVTAAKPAVESDAAMLMVSVPADATVTVNGYETKSDGEVRQFMSRGLSEGFVYTYKVEATYEVDGQQMTETKSVKLRAGEMQTVEFDPEQAQPVATSDQAVTEDDSAEQNADASANEEGGKASEGSDSAAEEAASDSDSADSATAEEPVLTEVKLRVPADAEVTLAGNPTKGTGRTRTFRTRQLTAGQQWTDYTVQVTAQVNGQPITKQRTINVIAGTTNELSFDFDSNSVASR